MAEPLKNIYNDLFFAEFTQSILTTNPGFKVKKFMADCRNKQWENMELKQRMRHLSTILHHNLNGDYKKKLSQVLKIIKALPSKSAAQYSSLAYMLFPDFVEQYGLDDPEISLKAMEKITLFTSCEFAIRPYLIKYPGIVMEQMLIWSKHPNEKLRRFSSEGCRPRLPWAIAIPYLKNDPSPILPILENLKNDSSLYVRKSVANNLNDIAKDHPALVLNIAKNWKGESVETDWIIKQGCRGLLKQANREALILFGTRGDVNCRVTNLVLNKTKIRIGETIQFSFELLLKENKPATLRIEYALYFMKSNGRQNKKIFKITENNYACKKKIPFFKQQSFKDLTTRKHYPGAHFIAIVVNGKELCKKEFMVTV